MAVYTVTPQDQADIAGLYAAFWNRAPDTSGFGYWCEKLASGASIDDIATEFRNLPEGVAEYPLWSTNAELVTEVYNNVFGRAPDAEGFAFWLGKLNSGVVTFPQLVVDMCEAALTNGSADGALFTNKVDVGIYTATVAQVDGGYVCDNAFNLVTADPASVATAEAWVDANNTGTTYTLTTNIDTINVEGQAVNTVNGNIGANQTYNTGDTVNGNGLTRVALVADQANGGANAVVDLNEIAAVNANLVSNTTLNELEFTNVAAVTVTNGVSGSVLTVTNADQATVHGFAKEGRDFTQTITYASTTGSADVAALSVAGTGSSTTDSTFNVANANTIEAVTLATSGTNYVTVNGGTTAAKYTITGNGTNNLTVGTAASTMTIDASASTGTNIINVGTLLSTTDSVLGGSGFDLLEADLASAVQMIPTVTGVEELELTFTAAAIFNASKVTGATDLEITPVGAVNATVTNLNQSVDHVYVGEHWNGSGSAITATGAIAVGYATGSNSDVTFDVGATATNSNPAVSIGNVTFTGNTGALHVHSIGDAANTVGSITANSVSALHVHGETQAVTTGALSATAATEVMVSGDLKNTTVGAITVDETLTALNVISGAGTVTTGAVTQTAGSGDINTTYTYTGGAKALTGGAVTAGAAANADLTAVVNVAAAAGAVAVGALSYTGSGSATADVTNVTLTAEGTESTGTVALTGLTVNEGALNTSSTTVDLQGNGGAVTLTALTLTDSDTNSISLNAASSNVTLTTLTNTLSTTTDIVVSAASGQTATIGTLAGTGNLNSITATGAGTVSMFAAGSTAVTGDTVIDATGLTGTFTLDLNAAVGNLNVTLGNATNTVTTGAGADVVVGGTGVDAITANAGNDNITLGSGADTFAFANVVTAAHASAVTATVAEIVADVGSDTVTSFVVADDTFIIDQTVFGTVFAAGAATVANFDVVATTATAINAGTTDVGNIIVVQAAANAAASIYYLDSAGAGSTVAAELAAGNATLIGTISSVTGTIALTDFTVVV